MRKYIITTESGSDLPQEMIERYDVYIVPMHVTMGDHTYPDGSFNVQDLFDYYEETETLPKTSGSTPQDCITVFQQIFDKYPDVHIIHIGYSAVTTVSFNAARIASGGFKNIHLVDSKHVTLGLAAIVKATAQFIEKNPDVSPEEIIAFVKDIRERTKMVFLPKTLLYLRAGGRVSNLAFLGANLLKLHPTIKLDNGYLVSGKKHRGSFERCINKMICDFFNTYTIEPETVLVGGAPGVTESQKDGIFDLLEKYKAKPKRWLETGAVISCHGGPGAVGLVGIEK